MVTKNLNRSTALFVVVFVAVSSLHSAAAMIPPTSPPVPSVAAADATIRIGVRNSSQVKKRWIVKDRKTGMVILDASFDPKEIKWISVSSSNGKSGDIEYRHANRSYWSGKGVDAGKVHDLY